MQYGTVQFVFINAITGEDISSLITHVFSVSLTSSHVYVVLSSVSLSSFTPNPRAEILHAEIRDGLFRFDTHDSLPRVFFSIFILPRSHLGQCRAH